MIPYKCKLCKIKGNRDSIRKHLKEKHKIRKDLGKYMSIVENLSIKQKLLRHFDKK